MLGILLGSVNSLSNIFWQGPVVAVLVILLGVGVLLTRRRRVIIIVFILVGVAHLRNDAVE